jgi:hypothetical protein
MGRQPLDPILADLARKAGELPLPGRGFHPEFDDTRAAPFWIVTPNRGVGRHYVQLNVCGKQITAGIFSEMRRARLYADACVYHFAQYRRMKFGTDPRARCWFSTDPGFVRDGLLAEWPELAEHLKAVEAHLLSTGKIKLRTAQASLSTSAKTAGGRVGIWDAVEMLASQRKQLDSLLESLASIRAELAPLEVVEAKLAQLTHRLENGVQRELGRHKEAFLKRLAALPADASPSAAEVAEMAFPNIP